jgi:hypothetical protein
MTTSRIPPDEPAARDFGEQLRKLGVERARAQRRVRRRRLGMGAAVVALLAGGAPVVATKVSIIDKGTIDGEPRPQEHFKREAGDRRLAQASSADPVERQPWGMRLYTSTQGETCVVVGRVVGERLGRLDGASFEELPANAEGVCADFGKVHILATYRGYSASGGRTIVYGVADRTISGLVLVRAGRATSIPIARDGSFVLAMRGGNAAAGAELRIEGAGGTVRQPLGPPTG